MREELKSKLDNVLSEITTDIPKYNIVIPDNIEHGDFATNVAMQLTKELKRNPKDIANDIISRLKAKYGDVISAEVAGPGFINFKFSNAVFHDAVKKILSDDKFFNNNLGENKKIMVEFVSANPTGPLHVGHGRGAAYGDSLARVLSVSGYKVYREYYINDAGNQMNNLALSVFARLKEKLCIAFPFPENGYHGEYIKDIAFNVLEEYPDIDTYPHEDALKICLRMAIKAISENIENDLKKFRVTFDNWFSETTLYKSGEIEDVLKKLKKNEYAYSDNGALWLSSSKLGDDKDRVLKKTTGEYTYLTPDIAYHANKYERGFDLLIDVWGADHHGYIARMKAAIKALGYDESTFTVSLIQMVSLIKGGEKISMSTRSGSFIELDWLINEVGLDAVRFFYNMRSHDAQFDFDIDLAKSRNNENPVYYIQYAHARVYSLLSNAKEKGHTFSNGNGLEKLTLDSEISLIKEAIKLKHIIESSAANLEPHRITYYLQDLAAKFHAYYYANQIIILEDKELTDARLTLALAIAKTIKFGLDLLGVSAPERM